MLAAYFSLVVIYNCFAVHVFASDNWNKHIFIQCSAVFEAVLPNINQRFGVYGILLQIGVLEKNPKQNNHDEDGNPEPMTFTQAM